VLTVNFELVVSALILKMGPFIGNSAPYKFFLRKNPTKYSDVRYMDPLEAFLKQIEINAYETVKQNTEKLFYMMNLLPESPIAKDLKPLIFNREGF
jgi:hypothetical protein